MTLDIRLDLLQTLEEVKLIWAWLNEFPRYNFDDYAKRTEQEFAEHIAQRVEAGHILMMARYLGEPIGVVGMQVLSDRLAIFRGICFTKSVHGTGVPREAVRHFIDFFFHRGIQKIHAQYMADNGRVRTFLKRMGATDEALFHSETMRGGKPIDVRSVAFFAKHWKKDEVI
jgi:RimJ/RimL family protein N-acetyltransferase